VAFVEWGDISSLPAWPLRSPSSPQSSLSLKKYEVTKPQIEGCGLLGTLRTIAASATPRRYISNGMENYLPREHRKLSVARRQGQKHCSRYILPLTSSCFIGHQNLFPTEVYPPQSINDPASYILGSKKGKDDDYLSRLSFDAVQKCIPRSIADPCSRRVGDLSFEGTPAAESSV
jgi:hypothetical protein